MSLPVAELLGAVEVNVESLADAGLNSLEVNPFSFRVSGKEFFLTLAWLQRHKRYYYVVRDASTGDRLQNGGGLLPPNESLTFRSVLPDPRAPDMRISFASRRAGRPPIRPDTIGQNFVLVTAAGRFPW